MNVGENILTDSMIKVYQKADYVLPGHGPIDMLPNSCDRMSAALFGYTTLGISRKDNHPAGRRGIGRSPIAPN